MPFDVRKSTRPEIALVEPVGTGPSSCSRSAVVIAVSRIPSRKTAIIMAEDSGLCLVPLSLFVLGFAFSTVYTVNHSNNFQLHDQLTVAVALLVLSTVCTLWLLVKSGVDFVFHKDQSG